MSRPRVLFLTADDPNEKNFWNRELLDGIITDNSAIDTSFMSWMSPSFDPSRIAASYTHVCLLTAAHYDQHLDSFLALAATQLPQMQKSNPSIRILNTPGLTVWNANKTYLLDLQAAGFLMPQTVVLEPGKSSEEVQTLIKSLDFKSSAPTVLKLSVGVGGKSVRKIKNSSDLSQEDVEAISEALTKVDDNVRLMLQEYTPEVASGGEWSLVYVSGVFIGAFLKRVAPSSDEFRINPRYGGSAARVKDELVPLAAVESGKKVVKWLKDRFGNDSCAYMRMDGSMRGEHDFVIMELECIEPTLFTQDEELCGRLISAFGKMLQQDMSARKV